MKSKAWWFSTITFIKSSPRNYNLLTNMVCFDFVFHSRLLPFVLLRNYISHGPQ